MLARLASLTFATLILSGVSARAEEAASSPAPEIAEPASPQSEDPPAAVELVGEREVSLPAAPARTSQKSALSGVVMGRVLWGEPVPEANPLSRNAEPYCALLGTELDGSLSISSGGLANVLVRLRPARAHATMAGALSTTVDNPLVHLALSSCAFAPRVVALVPGQHLVVESTDPLLHALRLTRERGVVYRRTLQHDEPAPELKFSAPGTYRVGCDVHPWEVAWIVVSPPEDAPHFSVTDAQGHFRVEGLPPGLYTVDAWHERASIRGPSIRLRAGQLQRVALHAVPTPELAHDDSRSRLSP
jgi:plastocyanin